MGRKLRMTAKMGLLCVLGSKVFRVFDWGHVNSGLLLRLRLLVCCKILALHNITDSWLEMYFWLNL